MGTASEFQAKITAGDANLDRLREAVNADPGTWSTDEGVVVDNLRKILRDAAIQTTIVDSATFTTDGTVGPYTLPRDPVSVDSVFVSLGGRPQVPTVAFTIVTMAGSPSGKGIQFTSAPPIGVEGFVVVTEPVAGVSATDPGMIVMPDGLSVEEWAERLQGGFTSRAELVTWWGTYGANVPTGVVISDGIVSYVVMPIGHALYGTNPISDLPGTVPFERYTPNHYAENTTPGTTDMASAIASCLNNHGEADFLSEIYRIDSNVSVSGETFVLRGAGKGHTIIRSTSGTYDFITFGHTSAIYNLSVESITFQHRGASDRTGGAALSSSARVIHGGVVDCQFEAVYDGISFIASGRFRIMWNDFLAGGGTYGRSTKGGYCITLDGDGTTAAKSTDVHISHNQFHNEGPSPSTSYMLGAIRIKGADGVYAAHNHIHGCDYCLRVDPTDTVDEQTIASIMFGNNYCDTTFENHVALFGAASTAYRNIQVKGNQFRDARGAGGSIQVNLTAGAVEELEIDGNTFRQIDYSGVSVSAAKAINSTCRNNTFIDCNEVNSASHADVNISAENWFISGNKHLRGGTLGRGISLTASAGVIANNDLTQSTAANAVSTSTATVKVYGNAGYAMVAEGTATILSGTREIAVTHGLDLTPNTPDIRLTIGDVNVSGSTRVGVKLASVTSTQFIIESNANVAADFPIYWKVDAQRY